MTRSHELIRLGKFVSAIRRDKAEARANLNGSQGQDGSMRRKKSLQEKTSYSRTVCKPTGCRDWGTARSSSRAARTA